MAGPVRLFEVFEDMRCMSFASTTEQIRNQTKIVTRRMGWKFLKRGDLIEAVAKYRGVRKKNRKRLATIMVTNVYRERLSDISRYDCDREGFQHYSRGQFIDLFCKMNNCKRGTWVTVIWFYHV